jgi:hypothetical protein
VVAKQIVPEVAAATRVVTALYAQATGKVDFDAATQASLIDPALPSFSAPYTAALLRERELLGDPSIAKPPRILSKGADSIMCARPMPLFALSTPPQPPPAVFSVPSAAQNRSELLSGHVLRGQAAALARSGCRRRGADRPIMGGDAEVCTRGSADAGRTAAPARTPDCGTPSHARPPTRCATAGLACGWAMALGTLPHCSLCQCAGRGLAQLPHTDG